MTSDVLYAAVCHDIENVKQDDLTVYKLSALNFCADMFCTKWHTLKYPDRIIESNINRQHMWKKKEPWRQHMIDVMQYWLDEYRK